MNTVCLAGRLTADVEKVEYGDKKAKKLMGRFTIAVRDGLNEKGEPQAQFIRCVMFGENGVNALAEFAGKGDAISVTGRLKNGMYEDKEGITRYTTDVIVSDFDFLNSSRREAEEDAKEYKKQNGKYHK